MISFIIKIESRCGMNEKEKLVLKVMKEHRILTKEELIQKTELSEEIITPVLQNLQNLFFEVK